MEIEIIFDSETGKVKIEAVGFNGAGCTAATQPFENALGVVVEREYKPEYEEQRLTRNHNTLQNRVRY